MTYSFLSSQGESDLPVTDMIVYDMSYVLVVLDAKSIALIKIDYGRFYDVYTNEDLIGIVDNESQVEAVKGYLDGEKYKFVSVEKVEENYWIR